MNKINKAQPIEAPYEEYLNRIGYFTPSIEDIRVGYECEANMKVVGSLRDEWLPITMKGVGQEVVFYHSKGVYRVPYLTKEQIEAEGWREIHYREYLWEKGDKIIHFSNGQKEDVDDTEYVSVFKIHNKSKVLFEGECKDINTFRYICKLLNIGKEIEIKT